MDDTTSSRRLIELEASECWELAATRPVGRLAWTGARGPMIVPINFTVGDGVLHLRTKAYSEVARECESSPVAFEIDSFDEDRREGWSVLMRGHAHFLYHGDEDGTGPDVWPDGPRSLRIGIEVEEISGRRIAAQ